MDVNRLRELIPATQKLIYLNTGWSGPSPTPVVDAIKERLERESYEGPTTPNIYRERIEVFRQARRDIAGFINAETEEITLCANTTTGINIVVSGFSFSPQDEVLTCNLEHSSGMVPLYYLRERSGVRLNILHLSPHASAEEVAERFRSAITDKTRLVVISHISYSTGMRLPLREINRLAHAQGALVLVDGAQTAGHIALDMRELEADFYALPGHKWLLGPDGVGALYIKRDLIGLVQPAHSAHRAALEYDFEGNFTPNTDSIEKFELTTSNSALWAGLSKAIQWQEEIGKGDIEARAVHLASLARQRLAEVPNIRLISPLEGETTCGLVCFAIPGLTPELVAAELWERGNVVARHVKETGCTRLSLHFFNTEQEVEQATEVVRQLAAEAPVSAAIRESGQAPTQGS